MKALDQVDCLLVGLRTRPRIVLASCMTVRLYDCMNILS